VSLTTKYFQLDKLIGFVGLSRELREKWLGTLIGFFTRLRGILHPISFLLSKRQQKPRIISHTTWKV